MGYFSYVLHSMAPKILQTPPLRLQFFERGVAGKNAKERPIFLRQRKTPKTNNYCLKNRVFLGFPGGAFSNFWGKLHVCWIFFPGFPHVTGLKTPVELANWFQTIHNSKQTHPRFFSKRAGPRKVQVDQTACSLVRTRESGNPLLVDDP